MTQCHVLEDPNLSVYCHGNLTCHRGNDIALWKVGE